MPTEMKLDDVVMQDLAAEVAEWVEAFDQVVAADREQGAELLEALRQRAGETGLATVGGVTTPYWNTIRPEEEVPYPGDRGFGASPSVADRDALSSGAPPTPMVAKVVTSSVCRVEARQHYEQRLIDHHEAEVVQGRTERASSRKPASSPTNSLGLVLRHSRIVRPRLAS